MTGVRTVLGDIPAGELGVCDAHDHLFLRSAQLPGQELCEPEAAAAELRSFRQLIGKIFVDKPARAFAADGRQG